MDYVTYHTGTFFVRFSRVLSAPMPVAGPSCPPGTKVPLRVLAVLICALCLWGTPERSVAQPVTFGAADDPNEQIYHRWWRREVALSMRGGLSLIGPRWRGRLGLLASFAGRRYDVLLEGTLRGGVLDPTYDPDVDETYDLLRLIRFARYEIPDTSFPLYLRAGPIQRMRLGPGPLVNFFQSDIAYDERTVGLEAFVETPYASLGAFTDNVLLDGLTAGRLTISPFAGSNLPPLASVEAGVTAMTDLGLLGDTSDSTAAPTAFALDARYTPFTLGGIALSPFASVASYLHYGQGAGAGVDLMSDNFINLARFRLRLALFYSGNRFIPGYAGPFYTVNGPRARTVDADAFFEQTERRRFVGTSLNASDGGPGLQTELRLLFFQRFELHSAYYWHLAGQALSTYHLRLFFRTARARLNIDFDRTGLEGPLSILRSADDQTALTFNVDYRAVGNLWVHLHTRYTFQRIGEGPGGTGRYLAQRRFEPTLGLRFAL